MSAPLGDTLLALVESLMPAQGMPIVVTEAELEVPLEVSSATVDGALVFYATPPHSQWRTGVLPTVHTARVRVALADG